MWGNLIAGGVVLMMVSLAIFSIYKNRKHGKCCGCPHASECRKKQQAE